MSGSSIGAWLGTRTPPAPDSLRTAIEDALGEAVLTRPRGEAAEACLAAAERLLAGVLRAEEAGAGARRGTAHALLAADALATYAIEAAADEPATLPGFADVAMRRLAAAATRPTGSSPKP